MKRSGENFNLLGSGRGIEDCRVEGLETSLRLRGMSKWEERRQVERWNTPSLLGYHSHSHFAMTDSNDTEPVASTSLFTSCSSPSHSPRSFITCSSSLLLRLPSGILKPIKLPPTGKQSTINLGRYGSFKSTELEGKVYGQTHEILKDGKLLPVAVQLNGDTGTFVSLIEVCGWRQLIRERWVEDTAEVVANNQHITSTGAQNLTFEDIKELKHSGLTGRVSLAPNSTLLTSWKLALLTEFSPFFPPPFPPFPIPLPFLTP